jgi:hypothetical protein
MPPTSKEEYLDYVRWLSHVGLSPNTITQASGIVAFDDILKAWGEAEALKTISRTIKSLHPDAVPAVTLSTTTPLKLVKKTSKTKKTKTDDSLPITKHKKKVAEPINEDDIDSEP